MWGDSNDSCKEEGKAHREENGAKPCVWAVLDNAPHEVNANLCFVERYEFCGELEFFSVKVDEEEEEGVEDKDRDVVEEDVYCSFKNGHSRVSSKRVL